MGQMGTQDGRSWLHWLPVSGLGLPVQRNCPLSPCSAWSTCTTFTPEVATQGQRVSKDTSQAAAQETWA